MIESLLSVSSAIFSDGLAPASPSPEHRALGQARWLAGRLAGATLILMAIGSATRVMNAGLACPDWPLCYGQLVPSQQMNLQVFLEWFHRLDASLVGFGTLGLAGLSLWKRRLLPGWLPWASLLALGLVMFQGVLGALTVTELLRFDIVTAHLATALLFFSVLLSIFAVLIPYRAVGSAGRLRWLGLVAAVLVYGQSLLGGLVASQWALHQCLAGSQLCGVMNRHVWGVVPSSLAVLALVVTTLRMPAVSPVLQRLAKGAAIALTTQAGLGIAAFKLRLQVEPLTVSHQLVGASLLGLLISFTILAWRDQLAAAKVVHSNPVLAVASSDDLPTQGMA
ncbi:MAG: heme A synthase [Synechococcales cyanobacterium RM1_1_8]|nr:heme A synthase [Synechococcales cyanobacterium RM1_1_8]